MSLSVKEEGNLLFKQKHYAAAAQKFSEAIQLDNRNPVFYGNRAACYFFLRMFPETLRDCHTAIQIDPHYRKAWLRKGDAHDELTQYGDSIESYCTALSLFNGQEDDLDTLRKRIEFVKSKILDPNHVSLEALVTLARLNGIVIPNLNSICTTAQIDDLRRALFRHPKWAFPLPSSNPNPHPSRIQFYLITHDEKIALPRQSTVELRLGRDPTMAYEKEVQRLLGGCSTYTREVILAEDWERCTSQQRWGTGLGRMHTVYEIYRGHGETRPRKNQRACHLLRRDDLHGPILITKAVYIKTEAQLLNLKILPSSSRPSFRVSSRPEGSILLGYDSISLEDLQNGELQRGLDQWGAVSVRVMNLCCRPT